MKTGTLAKKTKSNVLYVRLTASMRSDLVKLQKLTNESIQWHTMKALKKYIATQLYVAKIENAS